MKTSFKTRVSRMGLGSFVDINIFCCEISFYLFSSYSPLFKSFKSKSTIMLRPHKGNSRVQFNDTLLNFGLWVLNNTIKKQTQRLSLNIQLLLKDKSSICIKVEQHIMFHKCGLRFVKTYGLITSSFLSEHPVHELTCNIIMFNCTPST